MRMWNSNAAKGCIGVPLRILEYTTLPLRQGAPYGPGGVGCTGVGSGSVCPARLTLAQRRPCPAPTTPRRCNVPFTRLGKRAQSTLAPTLAPRA
jgi:hypothetical protein